MSRLSTAAALAAVAALAAAGTVQAAPPKPIEKTYTATAPAPDPTNQGGVSSHAVCAMNVPQSFHIEKFDAPAPGTLKIEITDFIGDWDLLVQDSKGRDVATAEQIDTGLPTAPDPDGASLKIKKPESYSIIACNFAGAPTATVKYKFTYAK